MLQWQSLALLRQRVSRWYRPAELRLRQALSAPHLDRGTSEQGQWPALWVTPQITPRRPLTLGLEDPPNPASSPWAKVMPTVGRGPSSEEAEPRYTLVPASKTLWASGDV